MDSAIKLLVSDGLEIGNYVTVIGQDFWPFTDKQGRIAEIEYDGDSDGPIGVKFPEYYRDLWNNPFDSSDNTVVRFEINELRWDSKEIIPLKYQCDILFGRSMWHSFFSLTDPVKIGKSFCMHECYNELVVKRILVNCWGSVSEADVCADHTEWHGRNCDGFPYKKEKSHV